jgi:hypothetical protein
MQWKIPLYVTENVGKIHFKKKTFERSNIYAGQCWKIPLRVLEPIGKILRTCQKSVENSIEGNEMCWKNPLSLLENTCWKIPSALLFGPATSTISVGILHQSL